MSIEIKIANIENYNAALLLPEPKFIIATTDGMITIYTNDDAVKKLELMIPKKG
jgi:hypothetical protein